ncbi:MAG: protein phosphatase 2C domain-containing protein [Candidatus Sungbacteria bacterium]|uniref:Protein phosphatase 2C domain-containing protein n=1 Tax=Candidatus Sungiibacteriota bacterium TaxID=2750080 RepID=A0A931YD74_9BACT|nr:protein phosphatase 2C domain-containing protein [Candidatus Sungbacteria bacterium]MBI2465745.1 protein phosphatase 2C domain-containing protein [Candidatus Sungbacteria bacterium]
MKIFKITEPISRVVAAGIAVLNRFGIELRGLNKHTRPQEDFLTVSKKHPIFAVADGVTLEPGSDGVYPRVSGAGEAARIFCEVAVKEAERIYKNFGVPDLKKVFTKANAAVGKYNRAHGRFKDRLNYWDFDLFAATAAFLVVKDSTVYWAAICDSGAVRFKPPAQLVFKSDDKWNVIRENLPPDWLKIPKKERQKIIRKTYRNGVGFNNQLIGYGVVTGEKAAERYLNFGKFSVEGGDVVMIFTDGFENYLKIKEFAELFLAWPKNLKSRLKKITRHKSTDDPNSFGRERTLIAIKF